jgi:hypothetical protein
MKINGQKKNTACWKDCDTNKRDLEMQDTCVLGQPSLVLNAPVRQICDFGMQPGMLRVHSASTLRQMESGSQSSCTEIVVGWGAVLPAVNDAASWRVV